MNTHPQLDPTEMTPWIDEYGTYCEEIQELSFLFYIILFI